MGKKWLKNPLKSFGAAVLLGPGGVWAMGQYQAIQNSKLLYNKYTGHYDRQAKRIRSEQDVDEFVRDMKQKEEEKMEMLAQRQKTVDEIRESVGVGVKYKTSTRNSTLGKNNILG